MPIEKRPAKPLPKGPPPRSRSVAHQVTDHDTLDSIAKRYSIPVDQLIKHNFGTTNPAEVNWYLRENLGCKAPTHDGKNWRFSRAAQPGLIYLPALPTPQPPTATAGPPSPAQAAPPIPSSAPLNIVFPPQPEPPKGRDFKVRMWADFSGGEVLNGQVIIFDIVDGSNQYFARYVYVGASIGAGTPVSASPKGDWTSFTVSSPITVGDFDGLCMVGSMGGLQYSITYVMLPTPDGMPNVRIAPFKTGVTLGIGVNPVGAGRLQRIEGPRPR
jgi:hypothetical protein